MHELVIIETENEKICSYSGEFLSLAGDKNEQGKQRQQSVITGQVTSTGNIFAFTLSWYKIYHDRGLSWFSSVLDITLN